MKVRGKSALLRATEEFFRRLPIPAEDREHPGLDLANSPARVAKMFEEELLAGYKPGALERLRAKFTTFASDGGDGMVSEGPITFTSLCAHHSLPFTGEAFVAYVPTDRLVGASKLARVVEHFSRQFQNQERLCRQVAEFVGEHSNAKATLVTMRASHECMRCRGVRQSRAKLLTSTVYPKEALEDRGLIEEFYRQVERLDQP